MGKNEPKVWVSVTSHRARGRMTRVVGDPGHEYRVFASWPPRGEYYQVPARHADQLCRIPGLRVLRGPPGNGAKLLRCWTSGELDGPQPGGWPAPTT